MQLFGFKRTFNKPAKGFFFLGKKHLQFAPLPFYIAMNHYGNSHATGVFSNNNRKLGNGLVNIRMKCNVVYERQKEKIKICNEFKRSKVKLH